MKIIDFRFRPNTEEILAGFAKVFKENIEADGLTPEQFVRQNSEPIEKIVSDLKKSGYIKAVVVGRDIESTYGVKPNNVEIEKLCKSFPDFFIGFMGFDPYKKERALIELEKQIEQKVFAGAAIDPIQAQTNVDDEMFHPLYAMCVKLRVPVIITGGPGRFVSGAVSESAHPRYIDNIAKDFPDLRIMVSHGAWPYVNEMINVAYRNKNVFFEMSEYELFPMSKYYIDAINSIIPDKVVFASAHPALNYLKAIDVYNELDFLETVREKIMWKNAEAFLEL